MPPNHPFLQDYAMLVLATMTRLQQQQNMLQQAQQDVADQQAGGGGAGGNYEQKPAVSPGQREGGVCGHGSGSVSGHGSSGLGSSLQSSPLGPGGDVHCPGQANTQVGRGRGDFFRLLT